MEYTEEQQKVFNFVKYESNHGIIDAVAGSGKTTTIIDSASLIDPAKKILFCAFNNSIAREISARFLQKRMGGVTVKTMHALGLDILKSNFANDFRLENDKYQKLVDQFLDQESSQELLSRLCEINDIPFDSRNNVDEYQLKGFRSTVKSTASDACSKLRLTLTRFELEAFSNLVKHYNIFSERKLASKFIDEEINIYFTIVKQIVTKGNDLAKRTFLIDFADMLYLPFEWELTPLSRFDLLFVDECQDLSKSQLAVALKFVKKDGRILSVGDPHQSIYGFTGADIESFDRIKNLPNTSTLSLSKCFRCPDNVIELAQQFRNDMSSFAPKEGFIKVIQYDEVIQYVKPGNLIISRTKAPLQVLIFKMIDKSIIIEVHEDEVKDFMNELRFLFSKEELSVSAIYRNGNDFFEKIVDRNVHFAEKKSQKFKSKQEKETFLKEERHLIEAKVDFIKKQLSINPGVQNINALLKRIEQLISGGKDAVKLSTIHRAKGLENETVFILDFDDLPLYRDGQKDWEKTQERNLKYVALTRTKKNLFLVNSEPLIEIDDGTSLFDALGDLWKK